MSSDDPRLNILEKRLQEARAADGLTQTPKPAKPADNTAMATGMRAGTEFIVALVVPTIAGYFLDQWLGTKPFLMILLLFLGVGAGFMNIYRISQGLGSAVGYKNAPKTTQSPGGELQKKDEPATTAQLSDLVDSKARDDT